MNDDIKFRLALLRHCWNHFYRRYFKTTVVVLVMIIVFVLAGCASPWEVTEEEVEAFVVECDKDEPCVLAKVTKRQEELDYEHADFLQTREDELRAVLVMCYENDLVLMYDSSAFGATGKRFNSEKNKKAGYPYIPKHLRINDIACMTAEDAGAWIRRQMQGF